MSALLFMIFSLPGATTVEPPQPIRINDDALVMEKLCNLANLLRGQVLSQFIHQGMMENQVRRILGNEYNESASLSRTGTIAMFEYSTCGVTIVFRSDQSGLMRVVRVMNWWSDGDRQHGR
jgi:hypothetical protein